MDLLEKIKDPPTGVLRTSMRREQKRIYPLLCLDFAKQLTKIAHRPGRDADQSELLILLKYISDGYSLSTSLIPALNKINKDVECIYRALLKIGECGIASVKPPRKVLASGIVKQKRRRRQPAITYGAQATQNVESGNL